MQFLILCCFNEERWDALPEEQRAGVMDEYQQVVANLKKSGHYLGGAKLDQSSHAVTVRKRDGKTATTDGPFAETKEQLGGYHLVECEDVDEAVALAQQIPTLGVGGTVEVRRVLHGS